MIAQFSLEGFPCIKKKNKTINSNDELCILQLDLSHQLLSGIALQLQSILMVGYNILLLVWSQLIFPTFIVCSIRSRKETNSLCLYIVDGNALTNHIECKHHLFYFSNFTSYCLFEVKQLLLWWSRSCSQVFINYPTSRLNNLLITFKYYK